MFMMPCPVCGEVRQPLDGWVPKETPLRGGGVRVEGTRVYCACDRPAQKGSTTTDGPTNGGEL